MEIEIILFILLYIIPFVIAFPTQIIDWWKEYKYVIKRWELIAVPLSILIMALLPIVNILICIDYYAGSISKWFNTPVINKKEK